jgi:cytosine/adenosine deaminase-related metal-dependent hydrolase
MQLHAARWVLPITRPPIRDGGVLVRDGTVVAVGTQDELHSQATRTIRHDGVLMPGFVNAHAHLQYGPSFADLASSLTGGQAFADWLITMTVRRQQMSDAGWRSEVESSWALAYASGTIAVADIVTSPAALDVDVPGVRYLESVALPSGAWPTERTRLDELLTAHPTAGLSPHTLYTLGTDVITGMYALARKHRRRIHPHLAETAAEDEFVRQGSGPFAAWAFAAELNDAGGAGRSPAQHLDYLGGLGSDVHVAHGTHLDAADRALLRERQTPVALCARSNAILGSGSPPVAALLNERGPIAVGTDSLASTPDLNVLNELRALAALATTQGYANDDLAARLLEAATTGGADAIGRPDLGRLIPGSTAAFAHLDIERPDDPNPEAEILRSGSATPASHQADSIP